MAGVWSNLGHWLPFRSSSKAAQLDGGRDEGRGVVVNYFDLGAHLGQEVDLFLAQFRRRRTDFHARLRVFLIEPHPLHFARLVKKYRRRREAAFFFFNCAVASQSGLGRLYLHPNDLGHSIYCDKSGVTSDYLPVITTPLSALLAEFPKGPGHVNLLKANIEGAELDLLEDLAAHGLHRYFDFYLGSTPGRFNDIAKVESLRSAGKVEHAQALLENLGVTIHKFCGANPQWPNFDVCAGVEQVLRQRARPAA